MEGEAEKSGIEGDMAAMRISTSPGGLDSGPADVDSGIVLNGKSYKPLADGNYDVVILSTGLTECVLAGLLSVRGLKVLQIDRNSYYGGECATYNLEELFKKFERPYDAAKEEARLGSSREYCVDAVSKMLMANGKMVRMLVQTGVTRYIDFNGIAGSYVLNSGSIYRMPVTPTEALSSTLISFFQKNKMRQFAQFLNTFRAPRRVAHTCSQEEFLNHAKEYYAIHCPSKLEGLSNLVSSYDDKREKLVAAIEQKYGLPFFEQSVELEFGDGPLGMKIETRSVKSLAPPGSESPIREVVVVAGFVAGPHGEGVVAETRRVEVGDIIRAVNGESMLGKSDEDVQRLILMKRPVKITFMKPVFDHSSQKYNLLEMTMRELYLKFGLDETTQSYIGHVMALQTNDRYLDEPAEPTVVACQVYGRSVGLYKQDSPYLYPKYGLSTLPEGFSRLSAVYGGTVMLRTDINEIMHDSTTNKVIGVRVGDSAAKANLVIGDYSYFPKEKSKPTGKVVRSVCILRKPIARTKGDSAQIILPAKQLKDKKYDVYVSEIGPSLQVSPKNVYLAIASTTVETANPIEELRDAFDLMGDSVMERFTSVAETYGPVGDGMEDNCYVVNSLDATTHFETVANDIMRIYKSINKKDLDLNEKLVKSQEQ